MELKSHQYIILCPSGQSEKFTAYGTVVELSPWPSLNNDTDKLVLRNKTGELIDSLDYNMSWYKDLKKQQGGYSLERLKTFSVCAGYSNWQASNSIDGATPGKQNSSFISTETVQKLELNTWE